MMQCIERFIHQNQVEFILDMQCWFNFQKLINVIHHINWVKKKSHTIISVGAEKASDKIQHALKTELPSNPGTDKE